MGVITQSELKAPPAEVGDLAEVKANYENFASLIDKRTVDFKADTDRGKLEREAAIAREILADAELGYRTLLYLLWRVTLWEIDGIRSYKAEYGVQSLWEWAQMIFGDKANDSVYRKTLIVERFFVPVYNALASGNSFQTPLGEELTPEKLIEGDNIKKMQALSSHFAEATANGDRESQEAVLEVMLTKSTKAVDTLTGDDLDKIINPNTIEAPKEYPTNDGRVNLLFENLTPKQVKILTYRLGSFIRKPKKVS